MTQAERDEIRAEAKNNLADAREQRRERDFVNQPVNAILGTRSNTY